MGKEEDEQETKSQLVIEYIESLKRRGLGNEVIGMESLLEANNSVDELRTELKNENIKSKPFSLYESRRKPYAEMAEKAIDDKVTSYLRMRVLVSQFNQESSIRHKGFGKP